MSGPLFEDIHCITHVAHVFEVIQKPESNLFVFDFILPLRALDTQIPVEEVGQLSAARGSGQEEAGQVWKLGSREGGREGERGREGGREGEREREKRECGERERERGRERERER